MPQPTTYRAVVSITFTEDDIRKVFPTWTPRAIPVTELVQDQLSLLDFGSVFIEQVFENRRQTIDPLSRADSGNRLDALLSNCVPLVIISHDSVEST